MHAKWVFVLLFSMVLSPESYFLWILWFSNVVYCCGKFSFLITFSLHSTETSLKSSIWRSFASYSKIKTLKMIQNPVKSVKNLPPPVLWSLSQMRCCTFVPGSPLSPGEATVTTWLQPLFIKQSTGEGMAAPQLLTETVWTMSPTCLCRNVRECLYASPVLRDSHCRKMRK